MNFARMPFNGRTQAGLSALTYTYTVLLVSVFFLLLWLYNNYLYSGQFLAAQPFNYPPNTAASGACAAHQGRSADHLPLRSTQGLRFNVTTPTNYRADYPHPMLVVWAPSGFSEGLAERFTGLTGTATSKGYVVVHVASVALGFKALAELATIPRQVIDRWCIAENQVFFTGHSDGGTVANALAVLPARSIHPAVIAPSAMGMQGTDMAQYGCPQPTNVMLMHNINDGHFPDYGAGVAAWWGRCNQCGEPKPVSGHVDCLEYSGCAAGVRTLFCQAPGNHAYWPGFHHDIVGFFESISRTNNAEL